MKRGIVIGIIVGLLVFPEAAGAGLFGAEPWSYRAEPIEGRVLDKETEEPIEGAVVVAQWILMGNALHPDVVGGSLMVLEGVTDADGRYHISGWGPKSRPWSTWLEDDDPTIVVFKSGYWPKFLGNKNPASGCIICKFNKRGSKLRKAYWNGKDVFLWPFRIGVEMNRDDLKEIYSEDKHLYTPSNERFLVTREKWAEQIGLVQSNVAWGEWWGKEELWTKEDWLNIKNLVWAIGQECLKLSVSIRFKTQRLPDDIRNLLFGDLPPCPGGF